jgi:hypothetical protein
MDKCYLLVIAADVPRRSALNSRVLINPKDRPRRRSHKAIMLNCGAGLGEGWFLSTGARSERRIKGTFIHSSPQSIGTASSRSGIFIF